MDLLSREDLKRLAELHDQLCVSIFMPTHRAGRQVEQNAIRFKNLMRQAQGNLIAGGLRALQARELLKPAQTLLEQTLFWQNQADGLALFVSPLMFVHYRLPLGFEELVVTTNCFHLKPLLQLLGGDGSFYLLAFSKKQVRLFQGSKFSLSELDLQGVPKSLAEALQYDLLQKQLQFHTGAPAHGGKRDATYFGTGDAGADEKELILRFFQQLDKGLHELLAGERSPLVLAGVDYLLPIYHKANTYPFLMETGITGNPDDLPADELHQRAWTIVEPYFRQEERKAVKRYRELAGSSSHLASGRIKDVVPAALQGRVDFLFVAVGVQQWGDVDPQTGEVIIHNQQQPGDHDILDFAAIHTLSKGGNVYAVTRDKVPDDAPIAAVFRY